MMMPVFHSGFATDLNNMMEWRGTLGYNKMSYSYHLTDFDKYCQREFPSDDVLKQHIAYGYLENVNAHRDNRVDVAAIRNLGKYQIMIGKDAYVFPADFYSHGHSKLPYIMSNLDLQRFFTACDNYSTNTAQNPLLEYTVPTIFRFQYSTGMRPREVRLLTRNDIDYKRKTVYIADSKKHKDRCIPVDNDVIQMCKRYDSISRSLYPNTKWFFPNRNQNPYNAFLYGRLFNLVWKASGNPEGLEYCSPYILRHNYATHLLMEWIEEGIDIEERIPLLSSYMGHETYKDTYYYFHLMPERISKLGYMEISDVVGGFHED